MVFDTCALLAQILSSISSILWPTSGCGEKTGSLKRPNHEICFSKLDTQADTQQELSIFSSTFKTRFVCTSKYKLSALQMFSNNVRFVLLIHVVYIYIDNRPKKLSQMNRIYSFIYCFSWNAESVYVNFALSHSYIQFSFSSSAN